MPVPDLGPAAEEMSALIAAVPDEMLGRSTPCPAYRLGDLIDVLAEAQGRAGRLSGLEHVVGHAVAALQRSAPESKESTQAPRNIEAAAATMIFESFIRLPDKGSHADPGDGKDARHDLDDLPGARRALCVRDG